MLQLIKRCPEYAEGYKAYCQELYDHNVVLLELIPCAGYDADEIKRQGGLSILLYSHYNLSGCGTITGII